MGASFRGDTTRLRLLSKKMQRLTTPRVRADIHQQLAQEALYLSLLCFSSSSDPYGRPWKPLQSRNGKPLLDTGRLRSSLRVMSSSRGFEVSTNLRYAAVHNYGATITPKRYAWLTFRIGSHWVKVKSVTIPKRAFFPSTTRGLPGAYRKSFQAIVTEHMRAVLR